MRVRRQVGREQMLRGIIALIAALSSGAAVSLGQSSFANWEDPHVHPVDLTSDASKLLAVDTADNRLVVFDVTSGTLVRWGSIPTGMDPISVRSNTQV